MELTYPQLAVKMLLADIPSGVEMVYPPFFPYLNISGLGRRRPSAIFDNLHSELSFRRMLLIIPSLLT